MPDEGPPGPPSSPLARAAAGGSRAIAMPEKSRRKKGRVREARPPGGVRARARLRSKPSYAATLVHRAAVDACNGFPSNRLSEVETANAHRDHNDVLKSVP